MNKMETLTDELIQTVIERRASLEKTIMLDNKIRKLFDE